MAIAPVNAASSTASNWLKEAQESLALSQSPGGMLGALQDARSNSPGSIKTFLAKSQNNLYNLAQISQSNQTAAGALAAQMAQAAAQKRAAEMAAMQAKLNPAPTNYNPPRELDPIIYFQDGSFIDTQASVMTLVNGTKIDITNGQQVVDPSSLIQMANGAYLNTQTHILTMADGTKIDTITGLKV